jgi:hypothetical protein
MEASASFINILLQHKAQVNVYFRPGQSQPWKGTAADHPLAIALTHKPPSNKEVVGILLRHGADISIAGLDESKSGTDGTRILFYHV